MSFLLLFIILFDVNVFVNAAVTVTPPGTAADPLTPPATVTAADTSTDSLQIARQPGIGRTSSGAHNQGQEGTCWAYAVACMLRGLNIAKPDVNTKTDQPVAPATELFAKTVAPKTFREFLCSKYEGSNQCFDAMMNPTKPVYQNYPLVWPADFKAEMSLIEWMFDRNFDYTDGYTRASPRKRTPRQNLFITKDVQKYLPSVFRARHIVNQLFVWDSDRFMPKYSDFDSQPTKNPQKLEEAGHAMALVDVIQKNNRVFLIIKNSHAAERNFLGHICLEVKSTDGKGETFELPKMLLTGIFRFTGSDMSRFGYLRNPFELMDETLLDFFQKMTQSPSDLGELTRRKAKLVKYCAKGQFDKVKTWINLFSNKAQEVVTSWEQLFEKPYAACLFCETAFNWYRDGVFGNGKRFICWKDGAASPTLGLDTPVVCTSDAPPAKVHGKVTDIVNRDTVEVTDAEGKLHNFRKQECDLDKEVQVDPKVQADPFKGGALPAITEGDEGPQIMGGKGTEAQGTEVKGDNKGNSVDIAVSSDSSENEIKRVASMRSMKEFQDMHTGFIVASIISVCILVGYLWHGRKVEEPTLTSPLITV